MRENYIIVHKKQKTDPEDEGYYSDDEKNIPPQEKPKKFPLPPTPELPHEPENQVRNQITNLLKEKSITVSDLPPKYQN